MATQTSSDSPGKMILVADDEPGFHALFRMLLEPKGFTVSSANDGKEALDCAERQEYALIFLDVHMPHMQGPEVLRHIRKIKPSQPVVILSSGSNPDEVNEETKGLGALACFQKPFEIKDILQVVDSIR